MTKLSRLGLVGVLTLALAGCSKEKSPLPQADIIGGFKPEPMVEQYQLPIIKGIVKEEVANIIDPGLNYTFSLETTNGLKTFTCIGNRFAGLRLNSLIKQGDELTVRPIEERHDTYFQKSKMTDAHFKVDENSILQVNGKSVIKADTGATQ